MNDVLKSLLRIGIPCLFVIHLCCVGFAQSGIITTYAGASTPASGTPAATQAIVPTSVALDGAGGIYIASQYQNNVYRMSANGILNVVAGNGLSGFSGDGGLASLAQLAGPTGMAVDVAGNLFIADTNNNRIRKVTRDGIIRTVAGNGYSNYSGDGGLATSAALGQSNGVAVDAAGNLFIADTQNFCIRKVTPDGIIGTIAGNGIKGFGGDGGLAANAQFNSPTGMAVDAAGNLFITDTDNHRIWKLTPAGIIRTVAGNGIGDFNGDGGQATAAELWYPASVAVDAAGNLFIADKNNFRIRKVTPDGIISTVAGNGTLGYSGDGGPATAAQLRYPQGVAVDASGSLYIADEDNCYVRKVTPDGVIRTIAGNGYSGFSGDGGPAVSARLDYPYGVAMDASGNLFIADLGNQRIRKVTANGVISTVAGSGSHADFGGDGGPAVSAKLGYPAAVAVDTAGNLFIAETSNHRIRKVTPDGIINTAVGNGIQGFGGDGGLATSALLRNPNDVAIDAAGNLFIADTDNHRIRKVTPDGIISTVAGNGVTITYTVPNVRMGQTITEGGFSGDGGPATAAQLNYPYGVAVDAAGNLFIADRNNRRIRKVTPAGIISTVAGSGSNGLGDGGPATAASLMNPYRVVVDASGNLFIADYGNQRIRKVTRDGMISTVAGDGSYGFSGDGGPATSAKLHYPLGMVADMFGNLYFADSDNHRIRKVAATSSAAAYFAQVAIGGGWSTSFALSNTNSTTISGNLILADSQGNPFTVNSSNMGIGSSFQFSIPAGGALFMNANQVSPNDAAKSGWAKVESYGGSLDGVATYKSMSQEVIQSATGVLSAQPTPYATIPVDDNAGQGRYTAYGIANPTSQILVIKIALVDSNGIVVDDTKSLALNPGQQIARYFNQDFANRPAFQGSIVLRAQEGGTFIAVALIQNQLVFTAIPVIPSKAANIPN
jgi:sugar lactone lactonase YvrE